jgi:alkaline phosphatase
MKAKPALFLVFALLSFAGMSTVAVAQSADQPQVRNVIFLLTDGTGPEAWPLARWVKGSPLAVDAILAGAVQTYGADSIITDSAPGGSAYATGFKGTDKGLSVGAWSVTIDAAASMTAPKYVPVATLVEGARISGRAVGIIATSNVQHATPAAFSSHWHDRSNYNELAEQQVYQNMDVVLSGGGQYLVPKGTDRGTRTDNENLVNVLKAAGYAYVTTSSELQSIQSGKVWGAFAPDAMAYDIDRSMTASTEPSLAEMTAKAVQLLSTNPKGRSNGFFLFVEGSKVDWAAHANDPSGLVYDLLAFDDAVRVALDFARRDGNTLVLAVADHGTGGITVGAASDHNYSKTDDDSVVGPMRKVRLTGEGIEKVLAGNSAEQRIRTVLAEQWGITDLSAAEISTVQKAMAQKKSLNGVLGPILSVRARLGWTTGGHTGADVFLYSYGPGRPTGLWQNTDIGKLAARGMGFDFATLNSRLFVEASSALAGYRTYIDRTEADNPVLVVSKGSARATMPLSKNLLHINGRTVALEGIVVLAEKLDQVFIPRQAVDLIRSEL